MGLKELNILAENLELSPPDDQALLLDKIKELKDKSFDTYNEFKRSLEEMNIEKK